MGKKINIEASDEPCMFQFFKKYIHQTDNNEFYCDNRVVDISNPNPGVVVDFKNIDHTYEVFAVLGNYWGGWNSTPTAAEMYNRAKEWEERFGTEIVGLSYNNLQEFNNLADVLVKAPRKEEIDNYLFKNFTKNITKQANNTSFFAGLKTKRNGKKADKLATEFNQPTGWLDKLLEIRNNAIQKKEEAKRLAKEQKMLEKANAKKAKEILEK